MKLLLYKKKKFTLFLRKCFSSILQKIEESLNFEETACRHAIPYGSLMIMFICDLIMMWKQVSSNWWCLQVAEPTIHRVVSWSGCLDLYMWVAESGDEICNARIGDSGSLIDIKVFCSYIIMIATLNQF